MQDAINADAAGDTAARNIALNEMETQIGNLGLDNKDLTLEMERQLKVLRAHYASNDLSKLVNKYLAEADTFHNADTPDTNQRDRMINAAQDQIGRLRALDPALADAVQSKLDGMKAQYAVDDKERARAKPVGRTEALDTFDAQVDAENERLRKAGDATGARNIVKLADDIAGPLNDAEDAHKSGDKAERDAKIEEARAAIPALEAVNPDLAEAARRAVEGNAARYANEDKQVPRGAPLGRGGPESQKMSEHLDTFMSATHQPLEAIYHAIAGYGTVNLPPGWTVDSSWSLDEHGGGSGNPPVRLLNPDGQPVYLKIETSDEAARNELWYSRFLQLMDHPGAAHVRIQGAAVLLSAVGGDGVKDRGPFEKVFDHLPFEPAWSGLQHGRGAGWFGGGNITEAWIKQVGLSDVQLQDEDSIIKLMLMNALGGNPDRHFANMHYGWIQDGSAPNGGYGVLLPLDHGRMFRTNDGGYFADSIKGTPLAAVMGKISNGNQLLRLFAERVRKDRDTTVEVYDRTLAEMESAIQQVGFDPDLMPELMDRLKWLKSHRTSFINTIEKTFQ